MSLPTRVYVQPKTFLRAAENIGTNSICQNGLKVLLRVTVGPQKRDSSAISGRESPRSKAEESTPVRD